MTEISVAPAIPFRQFVVKIHQRCNLNCDYCYVYNMADQTWSTKPTSMSTETADRTCRRIAQHAKRHGLSSVDVVLHGGEPLLAGPAFISRFAIVLDDLLVSEGVRVNTTVQTNGVLLNERNLEMLHEANIRVGVSLDGDRTAHDRHRKFRNGLGSYDRIAANLHAINAERYRHLFAGILCTVDLRNDPVATYESLLQFDPPAMDFLLPLANWSNPPNRQHGDYADWMIRLFDRWYSNKHEETKLRFFRQMMKLILGRESTIETIGSSPVDVIVVESDGAFEQIDTLKSTFAGAAHTGYNVIEHSFDDVMNHPDILARQHGVEGLCRTCRECSIADICGGGYYAHRYGESKGFSNPSVYCDDLQRLILHVRERLAADFTVLTA